MHKIIAKDRKHLKKLIVEEIKKNGLNCSLNHIDVSKVTNLCCIFYKSKFNGDISEWNVSNVTDMTSTFAYSKFNGDISKWNVSNVTNMYGMFLDSKFNGDISEWKLNKIACWDELEFPKDSYMYKKVQVMNRKKLIEDL